MTSRSVDGSVFNFISPLLSIPVSDEDVSAVRCRAWRRRGFCRVIRTTGATNTAVQGTMVLTNFWQDHVFVRNLACSFPRCSSTKRGVSRQDVIHALMQGSTDHDDHTAVLGALSAYAGCGMCGGSPSLSVCGRGYLKFKNPTATWGARGAEKGGEEEAGEASGGGQGEAYRSPPPKPRGRPFFTRDEP